MSGVEETVAQLANDLNALRVAQARLAREMADVLANLDAENMPSIDARIAALESAVAALASA